MSTAHAVAAPAHTNRLINATSPYLLQHAHNPVDWFPWGAEALAKAAAEDKPIFLSIGYSACHWCHVMERESFENADIAAVLNEHFVAVKVDREERPDLDQIYMSATMLYNQGQGGWPMSVFLAPDQRPFFAGTYFPPDSRYGRPGFADLLRTIARLWREDRGRVMQSADSLASAVQQYGTWQHSDAGITRELVGKVADGLGLAFDDVAGGLHGGGTNKFPPSMAMSLMLREYHRSARFGRPKNGLLEKVELTLERMAGGGIYDHLGGGICRYSTDTKWLVPHFEKMLYDQALVSSVYLEAAQVTGQAHWAAVAIDIFDYVLRDLRSPEGGFYSARDADSEGVEGKFYVWTRDEVTSVLGPEAGPLFCSYFDVTASGNWDGLNILHVEREPDVVAKLNGITADRLQEILKAARKKLFEVRERRVPPGLDDKVLTSWNALMIAALARGGRVSGERRYTSAAATAAHFILTRMSENGRLLRTYRDGRAHINGYLDDYAFFVEALLDLYEATFEPRWLNEAVRLNDDMVRRFWDAAAGGFFFTADDAEQLIVRTKETHDGAIPSGNSVALMNLLRLAAIFDRRDLRDLAEKLMRCVAGNVEQSPFGFDRFLAGVDFYYGPPREVVIAGALSDPATRALIEVVDRVYDPSRVVLLADPASIVGSPLVAGKPPVEGQPAAYVCQGRACLPPVTDPGELRRLLETS